MKELYSALAAAQGEFKPIQKTKEVKKQGTSKSTGKPFNYSYYYADLDSIIASVRPILAKHGLSLMQTIEMGDRHECVTHICHNSGEQLQSRCPVLLNLNDSQLMGGSITYAKRYGISLALGISTDDDLDANENDEHEISNRQSPKSNHDKTKSAVAQQNQAATMSGLAVGRNALLKPSQERTEPSQSAGTSPERRPVLSEPQIKRLYAIAYSSNWMPEDVLKIIRADFNTTPELLTRKEYEAACNMLKVTQFTPDIFAEYVDAFGPPQTNIEENLPF